MKPSGMAARHRKPTFLNTTAGAMDFEKLNVRDPKIKFGFTKQLLEAGRREPGKLRAYLPSFFQMAEHSNAIIRWTGVRLVGFLSAEMSEKQVDIILPILLKLLHGGRLIDSNHSIFALGQLALFHPRLRESVFKELLLVEKDHFPTEECTRIAVGKVIEALRPMADNVKGHTDVLDFVQRALSSPRKSAAAKAAALWKILNETGKSSSS